MLAVTVTDVAKHNVLMFFTFKTKILIHSEGTSTHPTLETVYARACLLQSLFCVDPLGGHAARASHQVNRPRTHAICLSHTQQLTSLTDLSMGHRLMSYVWVTHNNWLHSQTCQWATDSCHTSESHTTTDFTHRPVNGPQTHVIRLSHTQQLTSLTDLSMGHRLMSYVWVTHNNWLHTNTSYVAIIGIVLHMFCSVDHFCRKCYINKIT